MLIPRLLTAIVLIPIVIIALFFLPLSWFVAGIIAICGIAVWEWGQFLHLKNMRSRLIFVAVTMLLLSVIYYCPLFDMIRAPIFKSILLLSVVWWLIALLLVIGYPSSIKYWQHSIPLKVLFAFFTLVPFFIGMVELRQLNYTINSYTGAYWLLYVLVLVWVTDSGAYFVGRMLGKTKLAPNVSPGKTVEGLLGGVMAAIVISIIAYLTCFSTISFKIFILSSLFTILVSVLGDLTESMFKRQANIKDSGHLIPGHGGILDRIDSLTAAIPVFSALLFYIL